MKNLNCKIVDVHCLPGRDYPTVFDYEVYDGEKLVGVGSSSSPAWVKHDAGGYHTKRDFDELYPDGWRVAFDF